MWDALALFDLINRHPACSTNVFGCFQQARREESSQSRLPFALVSWRRCQSLLETLDLSSLILNVLYRQVEFPATTVSRPPGF